ncbi:PocR ligand-binding domain-containing protein [Desulfolucanica intricata]|uniref:PocR ligand-binding domain-containing protein n=1 Tax=Desulfolucanica intricata TaxID=1285191 RepID=UPI00082D1E9F|nr:PocR ligand-binding domain-containing protein [Desulfolucanica intricata]
MISCNEKEMSYILNTLQPVLNSISDIGDIWIKFIDQSGRYITTTQSRKQCDFCKYIRSNHNGNIRCRGSARQAVFMARNCSNPYCIECHAGLTILTVPIKIAGIHLGALAAGEIIASPKSEKIILQRLSEIGLNSDKLIRFYKEIPVLNCDHVDRLAETLYNISNCFIKMGVMLANTDEQKFKIDEFDFLNTCTEENKDNIDLKLEKSAVDYSNIPSKKIIELVSLAEKYIINNYNKPISLQDVANFIYINPTYLSYLFRQVTGYTFKNYLTQLRVEKAKQLLLNSSLTVSEISQRIGYEDSNYFSRVFKKVTGIPPSYFYKLSN